jgi:hypothetical protein
MRGGDACHRFLKTMLSEAYAVISEIVISTMQEVTTISWMHI